MATDLGHKHTWWNVRKKNLFVRVIENNMLLNRRVNVLFICEHPEEMSHTHPNATTDAGNELTRAHIQTHKIYHVLQTAEYW